MSMEIEIKAWVDNPQSIEERLRSLYGEAVPVSKDDVYYETNGRFPGLNTLRLRESDGKWILTYKDKRLEDGTEINREHETVVEEFSVIDELLKRFGCRKFLEKKKRGLLFSFADMVIELVHIEGLGTFLEIEKVLPVDDLDSAGIEAAREEILAIFDAVGIERDKIEGRYYSEMLLGK
ncbi:class IV adenylate cyclase [Marispirochaeta sp.]|uniref:class IV adenylate cyclase n=1 Tax=Marispirochaeta sp. TaxID=2038653 RepID=UPI0029C935FB|nr:class IV adenylate cyclase [Marispirochaeta sp.]